MAKGSDAVRRILPPIILGLLCLVLFSPRLLFLARFTWREDRYSYAFFIPLVSLVWLWSHRERVAAAPRRPANSGLVLVLFGLLAWMVGQGRSINAVSHLAMLMVLSGIVAFSGGWAFFRVVAFPVLYLAFVFPVPKHVDAVYIGPPLQRMASAASAVLIDTLGIPVVRDGNVLEVPGMELQVEEACSGIHSLYTLLALGTAFVFFTEKRAWERGVLLVAIVPIALAANIFRVTVSGVLACRVGPDLARGFFHGFGGVVVFLFGVVALLCTAWLLRAVFPVPRAEEEA